MKEETKKLDAPVTEAKESLESANMRLTEENKNLRKLAEKSVNENQILRATVKALSQLL